MFFLVQRLGIARAKELVYTARMLPAEEANAWGLINRVVPDVELEANALALAQEMAGSATFALALAKKMFQSMYVPTLEMLLETEALAMAGIRLTHDHHEGVAAFEPLEREQAFRAPRPGQGIPRRPGGAGRGRRRPHRRHRPVAAGAGEGQVGGLHRPLFDLSLCRRRSDQCLHRSGC